MGRPRKFEASAALDGAMNLFWEKGFATSNLPDILTAMNLTRGSFYLAYTDKRSLFIQCLDAYFAKVIAPQLAALDDPATPSAERLARFLGNEGRTQPAEWGCLLGNSVVEMGNSDPEIAKIIFVMTAKMKEAIFRVLAGPELDFQQDEARRRSEIVCGLYFGSQTMKKLGQKIDFTPILLSTL